VNQDDRDAFDEALLCARTTAYGPGEFVGQENFMRASEILSLASRAGITSVSSVLDLCCGVAGPGRLIARATGCAYLGVDSSAAAIRIARERARGLSCEFAVACVPPVPDGAHDVVLLLETMLAFRDKRPLLQGIAAALGVGGRFAFTLEAGEPLTEAERSRMPDADTVWLTPLSTMLTHLDGAGLRAKSVADYSAAHQAIVEVLLAAYAADGDAIAAAVGRPALEDLLGAHRLWLDWLRHGRVRKFAVVAEKSRPSPAVG
jgi:SAM-dependent methyltransferase